MIRSRIVGWLVVVATAGAALIWWPEKDSQVPMPAQPTPPAASAAVKNPNERLAALPAREPIGEAGADPFAARRSAPSARKRPVEQPSIVEPAAPAAPQPPPLPYRFAGQVVHDGTARVALAKGDRVFTVREGDMLDDEYRVESIRADQVTLVYLPLGHREYLPVTSVLGLSDPAAAAAPRPAQLRWQGPERVQAGNTFEVSLKVSCAQPVRASPLQLEFDAALLEPVAVRPGGFFRDGSFHYRVAPGGAIHVGAFGKGKVATEDELLVVTFRPLRSDGIAELRLASLALQGNAGRAIAHDPPETFRTAIVRQRMPGRREELLQESTE
jgi:Cohesin domain